MSREFRIEVFQEFAIEFPNSGSTGLRDALLSHVHPPWRRAQDVEAELARSNPTGAAGPIVLERDADGSVRAARLFLFQHVDRYELGNIVPCDNGPSLGAHGYNDLLDDFVAQIALPATRNTAFILQTTKRHQTITDWTSSDAAAALKRFSAAANKATAASHPADAERWRNFLIADYRAGGNWNHSHFERWLVEVEQWPPDEAQELALQRDHALELLDQYDKAV